MIQIQSLLNISDNTGARKLMCIKIVGNTKTSASIGNIIVGVVKKALPIDFKKKKLPPRPGKKVLVRLVAKKAEIVLAVVVRVKTFLNRNNGISLSFDDNAVVLITSKKDPRGTKIFGPVSSDIRAIEFPRLVNMSPIKF